MTKAFQTVVQLNEGSEVCKAGNLTLHNIAGVMLVNKAIPGVGLEVLNRKRQPPVLCIDARDYGINLLPLLQHVARMFDPPGPGDIRNVNESVHSVFDLDEGAKV